MSYRYGEKVSSFQTRFPDVYADLTLKMGGPPIPVQLSAFSTTDLNVEVLCVACTYLVHNLLRGMHPNIDTLQQYNLEQGDYRVSLIPYAWYLVEKQQKGKRKKKEADLEKSQNDYQDNLVRYLFVLQQKHVYRIHSA